MDRGLEPTARLLRLLSLLQVGRQMTGEELAAQLGCTTRTVRRDVERLRDLGYPIDATRGTAGYRLTAGARLPPLLFDDDEAVAIAVSLRTAGRLHVAGLDSIAERARAKLERLLPARLRHRVEALGTVAVPTPDEGQMIDPAILTWVAAAARTHQVLRFDYRDHHDAPTRRRVEPHHLVHTGRRWYAVAYDLDRGDWRSFRLDRITPGTPEGPTFRPREVPGGDPVALVIEGVSGRLWRHRLRALVHAPVEVVAERPPASAVRLDADGEDACVVDLAGNRVEALLADLCGLGADVELLDAPSGLDEAAEQLADRIRGLREHRPTDR